MRHHLFRGDTLTCKCADCGVERAFWAGVVYYRVPGGNWTTERPACRPVQPKAIEVRA